MFAKTIVLSDAFLDMPLSARCLYFTLGMVADDDGFVNNPKSIMRQCGAQEDDLKILLAKKFLIAFESGVIVIKHWRINNYLQKDRCQPTKYVDEKAELYVGENGSYHKGELPMYTQDMYTQSRVDKNRLDKDSKEESIAAKPRRKKQFVSPTFEEVEAYCRQRNSPVDPKVFFEYFDAGHWIDSEGKPVTSWKQKLITWEGRERNGKPVSGAAQKGAKKFNVHYDNE